MCKFTCKMKYWNENHYENYKSPFTCKRLSWIWFLDAFNRCVEIYFPYKVDNRFLVIYGCDVRICTYAARACYYCSHDTESFRWTTRPPHTISVLRPVETFIYIYNCFEIYSLCLCNKLWENWKMLMKVKLVNWK